MPVILALWEAEVVDHLRSGVQDQPGHHGETPPLKKKKVLSFLKRESSRFSLRDQHCWASFGTTAAFDPKRKCEQRSTDDSQDPALSSNGLFIEMLRG